MADEKDGVVIIEDEAPPEENVGGDGAATKPMSEAEFVDAGFSPEEIALAKENGMVIDPEKGKGEDDEAGKGKDTKPPPAGDKKPPEPKPGEKDKKLTLPEFTAEQEAKLVEILGERPDVRAFYFRWKDEKRERQKLGDERDHLTVQQKAAAAKSADLETRLQQAMAEVAALKVRGPAPKKTKTTEEEILDGEGEGGEGEGGEGTPKPKGDDDPENRPLTVKEFKELQRQQADEARKEYEARVQAGQKRVEILNEMEEDAKVTYPDFDHVMTFTEDLLKHAKDGKLADLYPEAADQKRVRFELRQFLALVANADRVGADDLSPSDFGYAIGKKHPKFAPAGDGGEKGGGEKKNLSSDQLKKMDANSQRRTSGGVSGGGSKRAVSEDEITEEQAARLSLQQWQKLKPATRDRLLGRTGE